MGFQIRKPTTADLPDLIVMIDELNLHEGEPTGHMTPDKARHALFGDDPALDAFVAEDEGRLIGFAFWHQSYETCYALRGGYVNDLYVRPAHRGAGVGKALLQAAARAVAARGGAFISLSAYRTNDNARAFYRHLMDVEDENIIYYALTDERFSRFCASD